MLFRSERVRSFFHIPRTGYATEHFKWSELACKCGCGTHYVSERSLWKLEQMRILVGKPFLITSACRCPIHNARVGGAPRSRHRSTRERPSDAYDIQLTIPKVELMQAATAVGFKGMGVSYNTFLHVDDRPNKARW